MDHGNIMKQLYHSRGKSTSVYNWTIKKKIFLHRWSQYWSQKASLDRSNWQIDIVSSDRNNFIILPNQRLDSKSPVRNIRTSRQPCLTLILLRNATAVFPNELDISAANGMMDWRLRRCVLIVVFLRLSSNQSLSRASLDDVVSIHLRPKCLQWQYDCYRPNKQRFPCIHWCMWYVRNICYAHVSCAVSLFADNECRVIPTDIW